MERIETHSLQWENERTGKRHGAGVAFYSEQYDEYRLKIDCFPESQFYLKTIGLHANQVDYRAEIVNKRSGKFAGRRSIGTGYLNKETQNEIHIELGPFSNKLILQL